MKLSIVLDDEEARGLAQLAGQSDLRPETIVRMVIRTLVSLDELYASIRAQDKACKRPRVVRAAKRKK
jgi:hypothetical protein